jgi:ATP-dependent Clp protease adaptor protein ClpS
MATMDDPKSNRPEQPDVSRTPSEWAEVRLLNDDLTPMEFVVWVLEEVFGKDREGATRTMLDTHNHGAGICGTFPYAVAEAKVTEVLALARRHQHPLQCVLQRSTTAAPDAG